MIVKELPEDFRVWEDNTLPVEAQGRYGVYLLSKRNLTTPAALRQVSRRFGLPPGLLRYAGLKDRRSVSEQVVTIESRLDCSGLWTDLGLRLLGRSGRHVRPGDIRTNRFEVVARDLRAGEPEAIVLRAAAVKMQGFVNYFDVQRFGSVREGEEFAGEHLVRRDWSKAFWAMVAAPGPRDTASESRRRSKLRERWGDWSACAKFASGRHERAAFEVLRDDGRAFRRAVNLLPREVLGRHLAAWQSYCWNEAVGLLSLAAETSPLPPTVPLLGRGVDWAGRERVEAAYRSILAPRGLKPEDFVLRRLPKVGLRSWERAATVVPSDLVLGEVLPDELHPGRASLKLAFSLPAGSYATMLVRAVAVAVEPYGGVPQ